ncbi:MAG TPA: hydrogenase [Candidatus Melainabacteria bacterium]|nr:hydrogenase [Candidatus Melainabacteria bacterium]HIN63168.1 hydrogenase [Candidatus Obscuribacterales bacterium]
MSQSLLLKKTDFSIFFQTLKSLGKFFAPVRVSEQSFSFKEIETEAQIAWEALRTILPPKKFFYPPSETLVEYSGNEIREVKPEMNFQVLFGVHPCDLAGLGIMDTIFEAGPADTHYLQRRKESLIIGLSCMPDKYCFCKSMGTSCATKGYDIFLTDLGDAFFVQVETPRGIESLENCRQIFTSVSETDKDNYKDYWERRDKAFTNGFEPDNLRATMDMEWNNEIWDELGKRCLSCGNCTPVCPTCYCFDLVDIASLNGDSGSRVREWDSCQFVGFAQVAGDYNFRPTPVDRLKFWYRHKLHGFDDPYGFKTCVGCGRCTVSCPAGIDDLVDVVKKLQGQRESRNDSSEAGGENESQIK